MFGIGNKPVALHLEIMAEFTEMYLEVDKSDIINIVTGLPKVFDLDTVSKTIFGDMDP